jgi:7,8-dihydropterin-6-yl-methyl-4-(beta-D-ribofuranosyl)aminobenzene 5'-phosphate synthase
MARPSAAAELEISIVYDNVSAVAGVREDWGFAAVADYRGKRILFDSGGDAELFLKNLRAIGVEPESITHAVISHRHPDHRNGIYRLALSSRAMRVFFLDSFPEDAFAVAAAVGLNPVRVKGPVEIIPGAYLTGEVEGEPPEQALVFETGKGLVVLTGCSHPGVTRMVEVAAEQRGGRPVRLLVGGFHTYRQREDDVRAQIARLIQMQVDQVAPAHCTGEQAKHLFRQAFSERFVPAGAGRRITLD